jgi:solute:Na+ symporter, SSS family
MQGAVAFYVTPYAVSVLVFVYAYSTRSWILSNKFMLTTQGDLLALRYNSRLMGFSSSFINFICHVGFLALEFITLGFVVEYATYGVVPRFWAILIAAAVMWVYIYYGGLKTVITANIFQGVLMAILGTGATYRLIYTEAGGIGPLIEKLIAHNPDLVVMNQPLSFWTSIVLCSMLGASLWAYVHNRVLAAESITIVKQGSLLAALLGTVYSVILFLLMMYTNIFEFAVTHPDEAFLWFTRTYGGPFTLAIMASIILATATGSISSMIHTYSTQISRDMVGSIMKEVPSDEAQVKLTRALVIVLIIIAVIVANMRLPQLINLALLFYNGIVVMFPVVILGLFWRRANREGALVGMISGFILILVMAYLNIYPGGWFPGVFGFALTLIVMIIAGYLKKPEPYVVKLFDYMEYIIDGEKQA